MPWARLLNKSFVWFGCYLQHSSLWNWALKIMLLQWPNLLLQPLSVCLPVWRFWFIFFGKRISWHLSYTNRLIVLKSTAVLCWWIRFVKPSLLSSRVLLFSFSKLLTRWHLSIRWNGSPIIAILSWWLCSVISLPIQIRLPWFWLQ